MRRSSGTYAIPAAIVPAGPRSSGSPSQRMLPPLGFSTPATAFSVVDLPTPLWPTRPTSSPSRTSSVVPCSASIEP